MFSDKQCNGIFALMHSDITLLPDRFFLEKPKPLHRRAVRERGLRDHTHSRLLQLSPRLFPFLSAATAVIITSTDSLPPSPTDDFDASPVVSPDRASSEIQRQLSDDDMIKHLGPAKLYKDMENKIENAVKLGHISEEVRSKHKGFSQWDKYKSRRVHDTILQIAIDGRDPNAADVDGCGLPTLVYLAREKRHSITITSKPVDLDRGNYERFLDVTLTRFNNITTGKIYQSVLDKEGIGDYLGKTIQVVPHINAIKTWIESVSLIPVDGKECPADVYVIELGGTVGKR
ncbi:hypothetical protein ACE6H2_019416 [Prunus campanulata]